jgi:hypothetical protein
MVEGGVKYHQTKNKKSDLLLGSWNYSTTSVLRGVLKYVNR